MTAEDATPPPPLNNNSSTSTNSCTNGAVVEFSASPCTSVYPSDPNQRQEKVSPLWRVRIAAQNVISGTSNPTGSDPELGAGARPSPHRTLPSDYPDIYQTATVETTDVMGDTTVDGTVALQDGLHPKRAQARGANFKAIRKPATVHGLKERRRDRARKQRRNAAKKYLQQTFGAHVICLILALAFEASFLHLCLQVVTDAPFVTVKESYHELESAQFAMNDYMMQYPTTTNSTKYRSLQEQLINAQRNFNTTYISSKSDADLLFRYEVIYTTISVGVLLLFMVIVYLNRDHPAVKSRGKWYLCSVFMAGMFYDISMLLITATYLFQLIDLSTAGGDFALLKQQMDRLSLFLLMSFSIAIFSACVYLSILVMRQRMIALIFNKRLSASAEKNTMLLVAWGALFTVVNFIMSAATYIAWYLYSGFDPAHTSWGLAGMFVIGPTYASAFFYYFWHTRHATIQFNDLYSNIRLLFIMYTSYFILVVFNMIKPYHVITHCVGWSAVGRFIVSMQTMDQFCTQLIQAIWFSTPSLRRGSSIMNSTRGIVLWARPAHNPNRNGNRQSSPVAAANLSEVC